MDLVDNRGVGELPAGTVTMLFSDIEGSTALLNRLGERYGEALSAQRSLMRAAIVAWHGHEMGTEGDSFYVVFESAADAVCCCLAAQQALAGHDGRGRGARPDGPAFGGADAARGRLHRHGRAPRGADRRGRARRPGGSVGGYPAAGGLAAACRG